jgi:hypothetical protein
MLLSLNSTGEYLLIKFFVVYSFLSYFAILYINITNIKTYTRTILTLEVFIYSFVFVAGYNYISYFYNDNFYVFSESDAMGYHRYAQDMVAMSGIRKAIDWYLQTWETDDLGMVMILYPLYHLSESNLFLNLFYIFTGVFTALGIFSISKNFMSIKYAFLSAFAYSLSSFVLFFHSIGLKESFLVTLVILAYTFYYRLIDSKNIAYLFGFIFISWLLTFFRPAVMAMIVISIIIGFILSKKGGVIFLLIILVPVGGLILGTGIAESYTTGGVDSLIEARESQGMIFGGVAFTYIVNTLAQTIGPLPTLLSDSITHAFYAPGTIYRILLAFPFWLGVIYIYKRKEYIVYPLTIFVILEMASLIFIMDGFELRKCIPQIPLIFIVAFWFLDKYDREVIQFRKKKRFRKFFLFSIFFFTLIIFYWNLR